MAIAGRQARGPRWGRPGAYLLLALLLVATPVLVPAAERLAWSQDLYNPQPQGDDVLLALPCGGAMAFRWVPAAGHVPAAANPATAPLYRLVGPFLHDGQPALLVGKYEVSRLQYATLPAMTGGPCPPASAAGRLVQGGIGWYDALGFAARWTRWLAEHAPDLPDCASATPTPCLPRVDGVAAYVRLPTEREWEYAARGGLAVTPAQFGQPLYPMTAGPERHLWYNANSDQQLKPIGLRAANPLGLHDLYGNVEELALGLYGNAAFPGQAGAAAIRGGSVYTSLDRIDAGQRGEALFYGQGGANRRPDTGLRLIADLAPAAGAVLAQADPVPAPGAGGVAPVAAVAAVSASGQLQVNVDTPAEVRIDGTVVGQAAPEAPLEVPGLAVGAHRVEISAAGYQAVSELHDVAAGRWTQVAVAMQPTATVGAGTGQAPTAAVAPAPPWFTWALLLAVAVAVFAMVRVRAARRRSRRPVVLTPTHPFEPVMIALPGGKFWMGSPGGEANREPDEDPLHRVRIAPFAMGKTAVTFAQYDAFCQATGRAKPSDSGWGRGDRPVINVSWNDAVAYAAWLARETGEAYRLPSEAEWEYAARAGTESPFWTGPCLNTDQANFDGRYDYAGCGAKTGVYREQTVPVGSLPANPWGLHEVHGNVREWVADPYHDSYYGAPTDGSVWAAGGRSARVVRGGSWSNSPKNLRVANRSRNEPDYHDDYLGFRLARTLPASSEHPSVSTATAEDQAQSRPSPATAGRSGQSPGAGRPVPITPAAAVSAGTLPTPTPLVPQQRFEPEMIALPGGEFWMGSPDNEPERSENEGPRRQVRIMPFAIGKYAITFAQYDAFCQATGRAKPPDQGWGRGDRPVINVSWDDAVAYAAWLARETREAYRLPSEAEWEYAARAGTETPFWTGKCIRTGQANYDGHYDYAGCGAKTGFSRQQTVPVGSLPANPWGLHEVHGNVGEWVADPYHNSYKGASADGSVWVSGGSTARVVRGGSWGSKPRNLRAAERNRGVPDYRDDFLGFRLARTLPAVLERLPGPIAPAARHAPSGPGSVAERPSGGSPAATTQASGTDRPAVSVSVIPTPTRLVPKQRFAPEMIALPGGEFWMGSPDNEPERFENEGPRRQVRIMPFAIGKYAITFAQYDAFCQATGRAKPPDQGWGRGDRPVINVSWDDAVAYAAWLARETREAYRLPSEAEWEYAARAGTETPFWTGKCIRTDQANYDGHYDYAGCGAKTGFSRQQTVPVGSLPANPWGLHEVHGNVGEWVADPYHNSYKGASADGSVWAAGGRSARVVRGGSWGSKPRNLRAAKRSGVGPVNRIIYLGFRLARTLPL